MFRTPTGQTGKDAYTFEMAAILNAQRELNLRFVRLCNTIAEELPEDASYEHPIPSDKFPDATTTCPREGMVSMLEMLGTPDSFAAETAWRIIHSLK